MSGSYQQTGRKSNCSINNQVIYPFFISNEVSDFSESI